MYIIDIGIENEKEIIAYEEVIDSE